MKRLLSWMLVFALFVPCFAVAADAPVEKSEAGILAELGICLLYTS